MGQFAIVISGTGGHGCERGAKDGEHVLGCQRPDCPDCIAREMVRRLKRNGVTELRAELIHWPAQIASLDQTSESPLEKFREAIHENGLTVEPRVSAAFAIVVPQATSVVDDLVTGVRHGSF